MATYTIIGNKVRAQIRRSGMPSIAQTFDDKTEAKKWATKTEAAIDSGKKIGVHGKTGVTLAQAIDRYLDEKKDMSVSTVYIFGYLRNGLGKILLEKLTTNDIVAYIQGKNFGGVSGASHFSFLKSVLKKAKFGWKYHVPDIINDACDTLKELELTGKSKPRNRLPTSSELQLLLNHDYKGTLPMPEIIQFAIATAMRQAEITRIEFTTFNESEKTILITDRKHPRHKKGNDKTVPLLDTAIDIIKRQPRKKGDNRVFPYTPNYVGQAFTKACKELGIVDLHFHDLRHEGTTRLFEMGYQIMEVQLFTGHEDLKMLKRYTHLKAKNVRRIETTTTPEADIDMKEFLEFKRFKAMQKMMETETA